MLQKAEQMANKRIDTMVIGQILLLHNQGYTNRRIAEHLHLNRNTVNRYIKQLLQGGYDLKALEIWSEEQKCKKEILLFRQNPVR